MARLRRNPGLFSCLEQIALTPLKSLGSLWSSVMRKSNWTRSIVPSGNDQMDLFGGRRLRQETAALGAKPTVRRATSRPLLLTGQYIRPIRVVAFNTAERWSEDVSEDIAHELRRLCDLQMRDIPAGLHDFTDRYEGRAERNSQQSVSRRRTRGSFNPRWRAQSRKYRQGSAGSTRSSSTATAFNFTSPTKPRRSSRATVTTGPIGSARSRMMLS